MDTARSPGITLEALELVECHVGDVKPNAEPNYHLGLTALDRALSPDGKLMSYRVAFDLVKGIATPPCRFTCAFLVKYSRAADSNMTWDEFKDFHAVAHLIPYLRELISNITTRMPLPMLMLPPVNVHRLLKEYREPQLREEAATPVPG